jgi:hypothetical protein
MDKMHGPCRKAEDHPQGSQNGKNVQPSIGEEAEEARQNKLKCNRDDL